MDILKDTLTLFLQLTALQVLLVTWLPIRKPQVKLSTAIIALNLDLALRSKTYGESTCLPDLLDKIMAKPADGDDRIIYGYRAPIRRNKVLQEISNWKPVEHYGPVHYGGTDDNEQRWESELQGLKWRYGYKGASSAGQRIDDNPKFNRGLIAQLHDSLRDKYNYDLGYYGREDKPSRICYNFYEQEADLFESILNDVDNACPNNKEKVKAFHDLGGSSNIVNIIQIKNPYHESIHNIHLRTKYKKGNIRSFPEEILKKEGFSVVNNATQFTHLLLNELPPNSERYCILETGSRPLSESAIEVQSDLLYKLSPQIMKRIALIAGIVSIAAGTATLLTGENSSNNVLNKDAAKIIAPVS